MQWVLDKKDFVKGVATSQELGGFWADMQGLDVYRSLLTTNTANYNTIGAMRSAYAATRIDSDEGIAANILVFAPFFSASAQMLYGFGSSSTSGQVYKVNTSTDALSTVAAMQGFDNGATVFYNTGTTTANYIYVSGDTRVRRYNLDSDTFQDGDDQAQHVFTNSSSNHPLCVKNGKLYMGDVTHIDSMTNAGVVTEAALSIPSNYTIVTISDYDKYLAIGCVEGVDSSSLKSKVFFWDTTSLNWNFEVSIPDHLVQLKNEYGILYALTGGNDFALHYFTGSRFEAVTTKTDRTIALSLPTAGNSVLDFDRGQAFWPVQDITTGSSEIDIWSYGSKYAELPKVLNIPFRTSNTSSSGNAIGALAVGTRDKVYVSYVDSDGISKLSVHKSGNHATANGLTVELDSYFGGSGALKKLNFIRCEFSPLVSGDNIAINAGFDLETTTDYIDGGSAGVTNSIRFADLGAVTSHTIYPKQEFRELQLQPIFESGTGDVALRRIVIDWDYVERYGN